jgi:hypothetical protein
VSFAYRVVVKTPSGAAKATYDPTDKLVQLSNFDVDAAGNCGEANFSVVYNGAAIDPRDIVTVESTTVPNPTSGDFVSLYAGVVVQAPNAKSDLRQTVRCVGLKQRLYELPVANHVLRDGEDRVSFTGDVAKMVWEAVAATTLPAGITFSTSDAPVTGFQLGVRYPNRESFGEMLDSIAESVGSFTVPTGGSYSYDGETFSAGDFVPAVVWGVNAEGELFFRRPLASVVSLDEADVDTDIQWNVINAEEVVNSVDLVYGTAYDLSLINRAYVFRTAGGVVASQELRPEPLALFRTFDDVGVTNDNRASIRVLAPDPLVLMTENTDIEARATLDWTNEANVLDGDITTFASATGSSGTLAVGRNVFTGDGNTSEGILLFRYSSDVELPFYYTYNNTTSLVNNATIFGVLPATESNIFTLVGLLISTPRIYGIPFTPTTSGAIVFLARNNARVYTVQYFQPDVDDNGTLSREFAESFFVQPRLNVSTATVPGIQPFTQAVSITPLSGSPVSGVVERTSYRITTGDGARTTYHVDQAFAANEEAQRVVLERLARRAVREGGQA